MSPQVLQICLPTLSIRPINSLFYNNIYVIYCADTSFRVETEIDIVLPYIYNVSLHSMSHDSVI